MTAKSNAARQAAYRKRRAAKRNATVTTPILEQTVTQQGKDFYDSNGDGHIYLGNWGNGDVFARILNHREEKGS